MRFFKTFKKKKENPSPEIGVNYSLIYGPKDFQPYNPDELYWNKGREVYDRMMTDDQVKAVLSFKQLAVVSRNYYFEKDPEIKDHEN